MLLPVFAVSAAIATLDNKQNTKKSVDFFIIGLPSWTNVFGTFERFAEQEMLF